MQNLRKYLKVKMSYLLKNDIKSKKNSVHLVSRHKTACIVSISESFMNLTTTH